MEMNVGDSTSNKDFQLDLSGGSLPVLEPDQFQQLAAIIYKEARIRLTSNKRNLLSNRLRGRLRVLKLPDFAAYMEVIRDPDSGPREIPHMVDEVTTNETYFYRNINHFHTFSDYVLPEVYKRNKSRKIRIWSAGCSSGEEAYTIAIHIIEKTKSLGPISFQIEATDLSFEMVERGQAGRYWGRTMEKVPDSIKNRYFRRTDDRVNDQLVWEVRADLKQYINFKQGNLFEDQPPEDLDIVFCRNVMIYFDRFSQKKLVDRLYSSLRSPGYLFIGHSESLHMLDTNFRYHKAGPAAYYLKE